MSYLDHIIRCNHRDLSQFHPLLLGQTHLGWVRSDRVDVIRQFSDVFDMRDGTIRIVGETGSPEALSEAMREVSASLVSQGHVRKLRSEDYAVKTAWSEAEVFRIDRGVVPFLGLKAYGVHVNGIVRKPDGLHLWIGKRAADKRIAPDKFDNLVAGGQPAGMTLAENLVKEAAEEASVPRGMALKARPVGSITYAFANDLGLKQDTLYCYDLDVPEDFSPYCTDGEVAHFELWPVGKALDVVRDTFDFKFNVSLVIIDFAIRHGYLTPDDEPTYDALAAGLHAPHPMFGPVSEPSHRLAGVPV